MKVIVSRFHQLFLVALFLSDHVRSSLGKMEQEGMLRGIKDDNLDLTEGAEDEFQGIDFNEPIHRE
eukprot:scaffold422786_cov90-Attheya_sp.AAC.1